MRDYTDEDIALFEVMEDKRLVRLGIDPDASMTEIMLALERLENEASERERGSCCSAASAPVDRNDEGEASEAMD